MAKGRRVEPLNYFLNEQHELPREKKPGGGRVPTYSGVNWANKARRIGTSLASVESKIKRTSDPLKDQRYFFLANPEKELTKESANKRLAPEGTIKEQPDFAKKDSRVFGRLGLDLIDVTADGGAIVHASPERFHQLATRANSLGNVSDREQVRWATLDSFDVIPVQLRIDSGWVSSLKPGELADTVIELQPLLTRVEIEILIRAISDLLAQLPNERLRANGTDYSGRQWLRGSLSSKSLRAIARDLFSVQSLHEPLYSLAAAARVRQSASAHHRSHEVPANMELLPCVAVFDVGVPSGHAYLSDYRRGQYTAQAALGETADHGSCVASRIVFGEQNFAGGVGNADLLSGSCQFLDVNVGGLNRSIHDKSISEALIAVVGTFPDVRVFNFSFAADRPLAACDEITRRERLLMIQDLDNFIFANDIVVVAAAGNVSAGIIPGRPYPAHIDDPQWKLGHWASGFNSMVCGSSVGHLSPNGLVQELGWPSPFTRIGPGIADSPVPGFSAPGGNHNAQHRGDSGMGVWVCNDAGLWEDRVGTSFAAPLLSREAAFANQLLQTYCQGGTRPFGVTVKAFLALTAQVPYDANTPKNVLALCKRTLGHGQGSAARLRRPTTNAAILIWQGVLEGPSDTAYVQIPIPLDWYKSATKPMLRIVVSYDAPVNAAVHDRWACRKVSIRLRSGPESKAQVAVGHAHASYPLIDRLYELKRLPEGSVVEGDVWRLDVSYDEIADYYSGLQFTPQQRVAFAAELYDDAQSPVSPHAALQALPISASMNRLSVPPTSVHMPIIVKSRI